MADIESIKCSDFADVNRFFSESTSSSFKVAHVNIRSLRKHWNQFCAITSSSRPTFDAFVLTEINVSSDSVPQYSLPGYQAFSYTRAARKGGGVAVFISNRWAASCLTFCFSQAETISLRLNTPAFSVTLIAVYRPPSFNARLFLSELDSALSSLSLEEQVCVIGDINIDILRPTVGLVADYLDSISKWGLECAINQATREEFLADKLVVSCIDHVIIRTQSLIVKSAIVQTKLADHYFVCGLMSCPTTGTAPINSKKLISLLDPKTFDRLVAQYDWKSLLAVVSPVDLYDKLVQVFENFKKRATRNVHVKQRNLENKWMSSSILAAIKEKDLLWAQCKRAPNCFDLRVKFKQLRNKVNAMIRSAKRMYFRDKFSAASHSSKKTWSLINSFRGVNKRTNIEHYFPSSVSAGGQNIADDFNSYFTRVTSIPNLQAGLCTLRHSISDSAYLPSISEEELGSIIFSLKCDKSPGIDGISISDLRRTYEYTREVLLTLLNRIISCGEIPINMKTALVIPLYKNGAHNKVENYRPISILPSIAQILEKHILLTMTGFLEKHGILSPCQYGFRQGKSTQTLLEDFSDQLNAVFDNNKIACALFLDCSKAFDTVHHGLLLDKLFSLGFRGAFWSLLANFLQGRRQLVSVGKVRSAFSTITAGVPQGSILSPLLFNIFVNDLQSVIPVSLYQYADDTVILTSASNYYDAVTSLQSAATKAMDWFRNNLININVSKTQLICFHNPLRKVTLDFSLVLHCSDCSPCSCRPLLYSFVVKYLGMYLDSGLSWNSHLAYVCKKLRAVSCLLYNIRYYMPLSVRKMITHALGYSLLRYGITIYGHCAVRWQNRINAILRSLLKNISYDLSLDADANRFKALSMPNFNHLLMQTVVLKHFWHSEFLAPYVSSRCLRPKQRFWRPRCSTRYGTRARAHYVPTLFNSLPSNIFDAKTKFKLKMMLRRLCI